MLFNSAGILLTILQGLLVAAHGFILYNTSIDPRAWTLHTTSTNPREGFVTFMSHLAFFLLHSKTAVNACAGDGADT